MELGDFVFICGWSIAISIPAALLLKALVWKLGLYEFDAELEQILREE